MEENKVKTPEQWKVFTSPSSSYEVFGLAILVGPRALRPTCGGREPHQTNQTIHPIQLRPR